MDFNVPLEQVHGHVNNTRQNYKFKFNGLLDMKASQEEVFDKVAKPSIQNALNGFNSTIFAYGQTGSGKTFTITGGAERYVDRGIIPRAMSFMFSEIQKNSERKTQIHVSYMELYNETGYDLLDDSQETKMLEDLPKVNFMEDDGNVHLRGLSTHLCNTEEEALNLLFLGDTNRAISETPMNLASSRSHCIFTVSVECQESFLAPRLLSCLLWMHDAFFCIFYRVRTNLITTQRNQNVAMRIVHRLMILQFALG